MQSNLPVFTNRENEGDEADNKKDGPSKEEKELIEKAKNLALNDDMADEGRDEDLKLIQDPDFIKGVLDDLGLGEENVNQLVKDVMEEEKPKDKNEEKKEGDMDEEKK